MYENISEIQNQAQLMTNTPITKSDMVYQVINAAPRMYKMIVRQLQDSILSASLLMTLRRIWKICIVYTRKTNLQVRMVTN